MIFKFYFRRFDLYFKYSFIIIIKKNMFKNFKTGKFIKYNKINKPHYGKGHKLRNKMYNSAKILHSTSETNIITNIIRNAIIINYLR